MSFWARLSPDQRDALVHENHALQERLGRPIRASTVAVLVTARRSVLPYLNVNDVVPRIGRRLTEHVCTATVSTWRR
jgi:hypothetical protein